MVTGCRDLLIAGDVDDALAQLRPVVASRTPFPLLDLAALFEERDTYALKGVGWGLKTIGKFYPDLLVPWLQKQVATKKPRKLMVRKAVTYLPDEIKTEFL